MRPIPRQPVPALSVETIAHGRWNLADSKPANFTLIVVYRGLHCPICRPYLSELNRLACEFVQRGVEVIALSSDNAERAAQAVRDWKLIATRVGYGLSIDDARTWGLYVSTSRGKTSTGFEEPALFAEPGIFLIRPDGTLYFRDGSDAALRTAPFCRDPVGDRFRDEEQLSGARRSVNCAYEGKWHLDQKFESASTRA